MQNAGEKIEDTENIAAQEEAQKPEADSHEG